MSALKTGVLGTIRNRRRRSWLLGFAILFSAAIATVFATAAAFVLPSVLATCGPIRPDQAARGQLIRWLTWRDLSCESPEVIACFVDRCEREFGRSSGKRIEFSFSDHEKKVLARYSNGKTPPLFAKNVETLLKNLLLRTSRRFCESEKEERRRLVRECLADLQWWETVHADFLRATDQRMPTPMERMENFKQTLDRFRQEEGEETGRRLTLFLRALVAGYVAREINSAASGFAGALGTFGVIPDEKTDMNSGEYRSPRNN